MQRLRIVFFFSSRRRHTRYIGDWSSDVCSSDLRAGERVMKALRGLYANLRLRVNEAKSAVARPWDRKLDRKSTRLNSSHRCISYAVFCLKKKKNKGIKTIRKMKSDPIKTKTSAS